MLKIFSKSGPVGMTGTNRAATAIGRFRANRDGVAAVEFALVAPLLVTLMLGAIEVTQSIWADSKVEQATSTIGDLVARTPIMSDTEFKALGAAGPLVMRPNDATGASFTVTSILGCKKDPSDAASDVDFYVLWSRVWQDSAVKNSSYTVDSKFNNQPGDLDIADGNTLIVTEGEYEYTPRIARKLGTKVSMGGYAFHQPRDTSQRISYPGVESADIRDCDYFRSNS